jgi:hypothetical protein
MSLAGVDKVYSPDSIKHAVITYLFSLQVDETRINEFGRWSSSSRVAFAHYRIATGEAEWLGYRIAAGYSSKD